MKALFDFIARHSHWFLFLVLEVASFVLLFRFNRYQGSAWFSSANAVAGRLHEVDAEVTAFFSLRSINSELTARNVVLEQQVEALRNQVAILSRDSSWLDPSALDGIQGYPLIPAHVIGSSLGNRNNLLTIDRGLKDGVKKDMGVVSGTGIVGVVYLVSNHYSVVMPVLNAHSNISCSIVGSHYFGTLQWNGGDAGTASVENIPLHAKFEIGDTIVTSGYSAIFPQGVSVGYIKKKEYSDNGLSYKLQVALSTDFGNLRDVCVIDNTALSEQAALMHEAEAVQ